MMRMPDSPEKTIQSATLREQKGIIPSSVDIKAMVKKGFLCGLPLVARHEPESRG
jgi:hypothetical protein